MSRGRCRAALFAALVLFAPLRAARGAGPEDCRGIADDAERLACYDALGADAVPAPETFLDRHWDLANESGTLRPWPHRPVYMLPARWTSDTNERPFETTAKVPDIQSVEAKFQISFKTKLLEGVLGGPGNLWFGYTQQSHFQIYNAAESRPFRETDFEPEAILAFPARHKWGAWTWRVIGAGIVHQSNGRSDPFSRSWNRAYALAAAERGNVSIELKPWLRFDSNNGADDDNPNIERFVGRFESKLLWIVHRQVLSLRGRSNLEVNHHKGSLQADWFFPIGSGIRGQLQVFSGHGESLIDYDHRSTTVGIGILLFDPF